MSLAASASALGSLHSAPQRLPLLRPGSAPRALLSRNDVCTRSLASGRLLKRNLVCASAPSEAVELDAEAPSLDSESKEVGPSDLEIDPILEQELSQNGFRSTRRTKLVVTIGPSCESEEALESMMLNGMNVARLNASHGTHEWHARMIARIRRLNAAKGYSVAVMMDTEGSEVHTATLPAPIKADKGESIVFTVRDPATDAGTPAGAIAVSYDAFAEDVRVGDVVVVDGGMVSLLVVRKQGPDVHCEVLDPGLILSRANVTFRREGAPVRARNAALPVLSAKDWLDIDFALSQRVDFIAVSFVKTADVIHNLRSYAESRVPRAPGVVAKVESADSLPNLPAIVQAADAVMVARGDLGAQINMEDVPAIQKEVVLRCRAEGKPVIVASHLLQSMLELPTPTRAEVSDVADAVRQGADALMLSGESAAGLHPQKALEVVRATAARVEAWNREDGQLSSGAYSYAAMLAGSAGGGSARVGGGWTHAQGETAGNGMCETGSNADRVGSSFPGASADCASTPSRSKSSAQREAQETCAAAAAAANALGARAIFVYTRRGVTAGYLSRFRPDCPIFAFTDSQETRQRLNLSWGVNPFRISFEPDLEGNIRRSFQLLKRRELVAVGDLVVVVSDVLGPYNVPFKSMQIRHVP